MRNYNKNGKNLKGREYMKKILTFTIVMISILLMGCSSENGPKSVDNQFLSDVSKATEARWEYLDKYTDESESVYLKEAVKKELYIIEKYKTLNEEEEVFNDPKLKKIAEDYIEALNTQIESIKYYTSDYTKYEEQWSDGYNKRSTLLVKLVDEYGLKLDEDGFAELKENAKAVTEKEKIDEEIEEMVKSINFENVKTEYDWSDYEAVVENSTSVNFEGLEINVKLLDKDGVTVSDELVWVDNWNKGEKKKLEFSTDKSFSEMKWELGSYYIK